MKSQTSPGYRVLSVDDSSTVRAVLARSLRLAGIEVSRFEEASTGTQALGALRAEAFDLVFCDLNMPGMSGFELLDELRRDGLLDAMAVVVVSSFGPTEEVEALERKGVRGYLRKPFRPEDIRRLVDRVMGVKHGS